MARAKGFQGIVGWAPGVTWGTAVAAGSLRGIEVTSCEVVGNRQLIPDKQITGRATGRAGRKGNMAVAGTIKTDLRYEGLEPLIANWFGTAGVPATIDTTGRTHTFVLKDDHDGVFGTLAYELIKDTTVVEVPSCKVRGITLSAKSGASPEIAFDILGDDYLYGTSVVNTTTTIDTITLPSAREFAVFAHAKDGLRMNDRTAGTLAAAYIYASAIEIKLDRSMEGAVSTERGDKISQPRLTGEAVMVSGSMTFPDLQDGTGGNSVFIGDQLAATEKKLYLSFTSPTLAGAATSYFAHELWLPCVQFGEAKPSINKKGALEWTAPFNAYHAPAVPTGFTSGFDEAITWVCTSTRTTDALA